MPLEGKMDAVLISLRKQEEYVAKKMLYMCFVDLGMAFDSVPWIVVDWAMRKNGIPAALAGTLMGLYKGAKTKVKVGRHFSEEFEVNVGVHHGSVLSPLLFATVIHVVTKEINIYTFQEILYADDLVSIAEIMADKQEKINIWKSAH